MAFFAVCKQVVWSLRSSVLNSHSFIFFTEDTCFRAISVFDSMMSTEEPHPSNMLKMAHGGFEAPFFPEELAVLRVFSMGVLSIALYWSRLRALASGSSTSGNVHPKNHPGAAGGAPLPYQVNGDPTKTRASNQLQE